MSSLKTLLDSPYAFWLLLVVPSVPMILGWTGGTMSYGALMHVSGEFSVRFLVLALAITPLVLIFPTHRWPRWLMRRRRYIGVAAFGYGLLHTIAYLIEAGVLSAIVSDLAKAGIWTGWVAFLIFVPLAATSNDWALRTLGRSWKTLQRGVYFAALFTALHWVVIDSSFAGALVHFAPLIVLEAIRVWKSRPSASPIVRRT